MSDSALFLIEAISWLPLTLILYKPHRSSAVGLSVVIKYTFLLVCCYKIFYILSAMAMVVDVLRKLLHQFQPLAESLMVCGSISC